MGDINKMEEECTHNCMTCGHGCAEGSDGVGKFEYFFIFPCKLP